MAEKQTVKVIANNKKAFFEYFILDAYEAGLALTGSEVKSIRAGKLSLNGSFCVINNGEIFIRNMQVTSYDKGSYFNSAEKRDRKLLMHAKEIARLSGKAGEKGLSIIPLKCYFKGQLIKLEVALCRGKKLYDKRETIKERDLARAKDRETQAY